MSSTNNHRIQQAITRSKALVKTRWQPVPNGAPPTRLFAIGDPQTTRAKLFSILDSHNLLGEDGMLLPDVGLLSIGDHFDYPAPPSEVRLEGMAFLRWLAQHPANQTFLIAGNHDLCRVMELAPFTDASYTDAQRLAQSIKDAERRGENITRAEEEFYQTYPSLPSPGCAIKDFLGFSEAQRTLVQDLLLAKRLHLSLSVETHTRHTALVTHAGVTRREFSFLGVDEHQTASVRADALNQFLSEAVDAVRQDWISDKRHTPLSLSPVHMAGFAGQEGGGLLYHRPANPARAHSDKLWEFDHKMPRRFDPRSLPLGLIQMCGHTGHSKCIKSLGPSASSSGLAQREPGDPERLSNGYRPLDSRLRGNDGTVGGIRTLSATRESFNYQPGIHPPNKEEATLYMIDIEIHKEQAEYPLFPLAAIHT